jgi:hypothetical protein
MFCPSLLCRGKVFPPWIWSPGLSRSRDCNWLPSCARICGSLPNRVLHLFGWLADSLGWKGSTTGQCRQVADRGFVFAVFGRSQSSQMLAADLFLPFCVLYYCWQGCRHTKADRNLCRWVTVKGSVSLCIMAGPGSPRCLQFSSVLYVVF